MNDQLPASFGQQRLWFLDQVTPGTTAYNLTRIFRLTGSLEQAALVQALQSIISRHESLRTVFVSLDDEVRQVVLPALQFDLPVSDVSELPPAQREQAALSIASDESSKPFDLSKGPLLRANLLRRRLGGSYSRSRYPSHYRGWLVHEPTVSRDGRTVR